MSFSVFLVYTSREKKQPKRKTNLIHRTLDPVPPVLGNKNTLPPYVAIASHSSQEHHSVLPILPLASRWFVSPDSLSSSRSIGSWLGGYVGSNWNGWTPLITLNQYFSLKQMLRGDPKVDAISTRYCAIASLPHTLRHNMPLTVKMSPRWSGPKGAKFLHLVPTAT